MNLKDLQNEEEIDDDPLVILKAILLQVEREFIFACVFQTCMQMCKSSLIELISVLFIAFSFGTFSVSIFTICLLETLWL